MKASLKTAGLAAALGLALVASAPAYAQGTGTNGTVATDTRDNDMDYGWIGLVGLLGLMGLKRKHEDRRPNTTAGTGTGYTAPR